MASRAHTAIPKCCMTRLIFIRSNLSVSTQVRVLGLISDIFDFELGRSCFNFGLFDCSRWNTPASKSWAAVDECRQIENPETVQKSAKCWRNLSFT